MAAKCGDGDELVGNSFIVPNKEGFDLRWFTPTMEVDLCGHATLASARVLSQLGELSDGSEISFSTRSGILTAGRQGERFRLDFPINVAETDRSTVWLGRVVKYQSQIYWEGHIRLSRGRRFRGLLCVMCRRI